MGLPLEIAFHNTAPSLEVETRIRQEAAELEKFYQRILRCRVDLEYPKHPRKRSEFKVRLELLVPTADAATPARFRGAELVDEDKEHITVEEQYKDASLAVHSAFTTARRRLEEFTGRPHTST
jgi:hypothetical protein